MFPAVQLPNGIFWHPHRQLPAQRVGTPHSAAAQQWDTTDRNRTGSRGRGRHSSGIPPTETERALEGG